jgi:uncharacterized BrkB/YihY/UPF0761 family membrane protein
MSQSAPVHRHPLSFRLLATTLAVLVFGLGLLAVAPTAHEHLHSDAEHAEHTCAIVLFAQGITTAAVFLLLVALLLRQAEALLAAPIALRAATPRRLPPACGPPSV